MTKHRYRAKNIQRVDWKKLSGEVGSSPLVFAIDVAKETFYAAFMRPGPQVLEIVKWTHPNQTQALGQGLGSLAAQRIEAVMEPSGTYGDSVRQYLRELGVDVYRASPKRVHDAAEVYDGVPSQHDAKAAYVIGRMHLEGVSEPWAEPSEHRRDQHALIAERDLYHSAHQANLGRLEALMSRHWPELDRIAGLDSASVLELIVTYGSPQAVSAAPLEAEQLLQRVGRGFAREERNQAIVASAQRTLGVVCTEGERHLLQALGSELLRTRGMIRGLERRIAKQVRHDPELKAIGELVGNTTSLALEATLGTPREYPTPQAYVKAMGLNLKERSSGKHQGKLKITKRGPGKARHYLYFSAMRLSQRDPVVKAWYQRKVARDGRAPKYNALVAVMRKLAMAVWHVARGNAFDSRKLYNAEKLGLA